MLNMKKIFLMFSYFLLFFTIISCTGLFSTDTDSTTQMLNTPQILPSDRDTLSASDSVTLVYTPNDAVVMYTLDGTDPSLTNGTVYTKAFTISTTGTVVKARSFKSGYDASYIAEKTFYLEESIYLTNIGLSDGSLSPEFSSTVYEYNVNVENSVSTITITPETDLSDVSYTVNGETLTESSASVSLEVGTNTVTIEISNDTLSTTYTLSIVRQSSTPSTESRLNSIALSDTEEGTSITLSPTMTSDTTAYTATVENSVSSATITVQAIDDAAQVSINDESATSTEIELDEGDNLITVVVTAEDGETETTYTITVSRETTETTNAFLSALAITDYTLTPEFNKSTTTYSLDVVNSVTSVTVTATAEASGATVTINGSTSPASIDLDEGSNQISVLCIAPDGSTKKVYTITVTREKSAITGKIVLHAKNYTYLYAWVTGSTTALCGSWPGTAMTDESSTEGTGWVGYTLEDRTAASVIFSLKGSSQTADLTVEEGEWWYAEGSWYSANPDDSTPPTVSITYPTSGATLTDSVTFKVSASDNKAVTKVIYYAGTTTLGSSSTSPFSLTYDTGYLPNATYAITAVASDAAGNSTTSDAVSVTTVNANKSPVADAGTNRTISAGSSVTLNGSSSYDPNGTIASYVWVDSAGTTKTGSSVTFTYATTGTYTVTLTVTDNDGATDSDTVTITVIEGSVKDDFRQESIYFVITTRFYDGDTSNNYHCWADDTAGNPDSDPAWRGDFKGLIEKLDYIKALGFSAIWITPPVKNASGYDYHGYHAINFKEIDPRYKTSSDDSAEDAYQELIDAVHAKGMKIIQDIVINHSGNFGEENIYPLFERGTPTSIDDTIEDSLTNIAPSGKLPTDYDSLSATEQYNARIDAMKEDSIDTDYIYHHCKTLSWNSYQVQTGQIADDCVDLNTENPDVAEYLIDAYDQYIDMGVDAFRVDTVKHVSRLMFNTYYVPAWKERGGDNFYIFGETCARYWGEWNEGVPAISPSFYTWKEDQSWSTGTLDSNSASAESHFAAYKSSFTPPAPSISNTLLNGNAYHTPDYTYRSGLDQIDFPMHWAYKNATSAFGVATTYDSDYNDATWNVTYVDSHDYAPDGAPENQRFAGSQSTWAENLSLMFTFRGIPTIFYGSEIEFQKGCTIDTGTNSPLSETGRAYFGDNITGSVTTTDFGEWSSATGNMKTSLEYPLAKHIQRLNLIRRAIPALQMGQYSVTNVSGDLAFKRRYTSGSTDSFVLVTISGSATFSNIPNGTYVDAVTGDSQTITGNTLTASCSGTGNARIYVLNGSGQIGEAGTYLY